MERLLAWYAVSSSMGAVAALIVANAVPLLGVLFFGWSVWTILIVYWLENGIVGGFNVLKMLLATGGDGSGPLALLINGRAAETRAKAVLIPFFIVHYGLFWVVHGVFVFALPSFASLGSQIGPIGTEFGTLGPDFSPISTTGPDPWTIAFAAVVMVISHGISFAFNYLGSGEYKRTSAAGQMFAPYGRLVVLHVTIIFGAFAIGFTGAPVFAIVILVILKTAMDLALHLREHRGGPVTPMAIPG
jgi:hypothetical protein